MFVAHGSFFKMKKKEELSGLFSYLYMSGFFPIGKEERRKRRKGRKEGREEKWKGEKVEGSKEDRKGGREKGRREGGKIEREGRRREGGREGWKEGGSYSLFIATVVYLHFYFKFVIRKKIAFSRLLGRMKLCC